MRLSSVARATSIISSIVCLGLAAPSRAQTYQQLYSFSGAPGDKDPTDGLTYLNGRLFGTTRLGGANAYGTVFEFDLQTGTEKSIYAFSKDNNDGAVPECKLLAYSGLLYGTTAYGGGADSNGTVFSLDPRTHVETVLHSFEANDGILPFSGLLELAGIFYGTTFNGGSADAGTVYSFDPSTGAEKVIYSFGGHTGDAVAPVDSPIVVNGLLYGTTAYGGENDDGTVFSVNTATGAVSVLASFKKHQTGFYPEGALLKVRWQAVWDR